MIRSSLLSSETLAGLSHPAERLFFRLVVLADDFGRYHASPRFIRATAMGLLNVTVPNVGQWLRELAEAKAICLYAVSDRPFLAFLNWPRHQRLRAKASKFPPHEGCVCSHLRQSAASADIGGHMSPESETESETKEEERTSVRPLVPTNGSGDPIKRLFDTGVDLLVRNGSTPRSARGIVGQLRSYCRAKGGDPEAARLIVEAERYSDPAAFLQKVMRPVARGFVGQ